MAHGRDHNCHWEPMRCAQMRGEERERRQMTAVHDDHEQDWSNPMAQTKAQLLKDIEGLMEESRSSTATMNRAKGKIDELRAARDLAELTATERLAEIERLRELLARFCEQVPRGCMHIPTYLVEAANEALRPEGNAAQ